MVEHLITARLTIFRVMDPHNSVKDETVTLYFGLRPFGSRGRGAFPQGGTVFRAPLRDDHRHRQPEAADQIAAGDVAEEMDT